MWIRTARIGRPLSHGSQLHSIITREVKVPSLIACFVLLMLLGLAYSLAWAGPQPEPSLPNFDKRQQKGSPISEEQHRAEARLKTFVPSAKGDFDSLSGSPRLVSAPEVLTGPNGFGKAVPARGQIQSGPADSNRPLK